MKQKVKEREYLMVYEFGFGKVSVQSGILNIKDKISEEIKDSYPFIDLAILKEGEKIGPSNELNPDAENYSKLIFTNIESLEVLERALAFCRKELELKNNEK